MELRIDDRSPAVGSNPNAHAYVSFSDYVNSPLAARADGRLTLPVKNVALAEWSNQSKETGNDEDGTKGALHARMQAGGSALG